MTFTFVFSVHLKPDYETSVKNRYNLLQHELCNRKQPTLTPFHNLRPNNHVLLGFCPMCRGFCVKLIHRLELEGISAGFLVYPMPKGKTGTSQKGLFRVILLTFKCIKVWKSHSPFGLLFQCFQPSPSGYFYHSVQSGLPLFQLVSVISCPSCMAPERFGFCLLCKDPLCSYRLQKEFLSLR